MITSSTLYICYFGLREPLVQTQVLPYLREIKKMESVKVSLLTFEPSIKEQWTSEQIELERKKLAEKNIDWYFLSYHKRFSMLATFYDVLNSARFIANLSRREKIDVLHARAHIPALMAMIASKFTKSKILFDIRGLMAEEYADANIWRENSLPYRLIKYVERQAIKKSSEIVVLTDKMRDYLIENNLKDEGKIEVIPCCVDFARIEQPSGNEEKKERFELIYAGTITGLYLLKEMGVFFLEMKKHKPNAFFQILTASSPQVVRKTFEDLEIQDSDYAVTKVTPDKVSTYLKRAHLGISFRKPTFSQIAASPTKIPEYLACGLPVISNAGIGDTDKLLIKENVGVSLKDFSANEMEKSASEILKILNENEIKGKCIRVAHKYFDLNGIGGKGYQNVYCRLQSNKTH